MRILFVVHGYPPRQAAGTERHVEALAHAAMTRGHRVSVVAADRDPARRPYSVRVERLDGVEVHRVVQNLPTRPLAWGESDPNIDRAVQAIARRVQPDVVHIHHLQFLSSSLHFEAPTVVTLHDQWFWCAAGGLGLRANGSICDGPSPDHCAPCSAAWRPGPGRWTRALTRTAGLLGRVVNPRHLHRAWQAIPARARPKPERGVGPTEAADCARHRNHQMREVLRRAHTVVSPSDWLAARCEAACGIRPLVVRHGLSRGWGDRRSLPRRGVVFIGTVARHKGPDLAVAAWRRACPDGDPPLTIYGPLQDAALLDGHPWSGMLDHAGVRDVLDRAQALIFPSRWPENAPLILSEARARGCPVVATDLGGSPELIDDGRDGRLVPLDDDEALAKALASVLAEPPSPAPIPAGAGQMDRLLELLAAAAGAGR